MRVKLLSALFVSAVVTACLSTSAVAATYLCPPPQQINCVPAIKTIGDWHDNNGQTTGNSYTPNNQCGNVFTLNPNTQRLLCCYTKCAVFLRDVPAKSCMKVSESRFECR